MSGRWPVPKEATATDVSAKAWSTGPSYPTLRSRQSVFNNRFIVKYKNTSATAR
jgi:hypothetical protein